MSERKTTNGLGFSRGGTGSGNPGSIVVNYVKSDGTFGQHNWMRNDSNTANMFATNKHFAYVQDGKIYVDVTLPIPMEPVLVDGASMPTALPYGIRYQLDVRDVTLGG